MADLSRRDVFKLGAAGALGLAAMSGAKPATAADELMFKPEDGASLRVLRWSQFVQGDWDLWQANTKKFTEATGVAVRVDREGWPDLPPKSAVAASVGAGPDIIIDFFDDAQLYPDKLLDVSDLATHLGDKYGGWYDVCPKYATHDGRWIALPLGASGACIVHRTSWIKAAGFDSIPRDMDGFLKLCQAMKANGHPAGMALGNAIGDGAWTYWLVWAFGGKLVDENNKVAINSPETIRALEYARELYDSFIPGTLSWLDPNNNKVFLDGQIGLTNNGISIYYAAKNAKDEKLRAMAEDINHANFPVGPVGRPTELHLYSQAMVFKYCKYPNAAKAYLEFMWDKPQYEPWQSAAIGYVTQPLKAYEQNAVWSSDPKNLPYRDVLKNMLPHGYAGTLGPASAGAMNDYVMQNMVAAAGSGAKTPQQAAADAETRLKRFYQG